MRAFCVLNLVLCAQLQFVCVQFYMNEAFLLSTGKDADRRKPAARETDCCINEGRQRLGSHSGSSSTTNNTEFAQIARQHMQCDKLRQEAAIMAGNLLFDFSCMH
ncbi:hypothetical protein OIU74_014207 [Salix koriyanagi]|uniref:Secreted protein n=1 Tax=Salix koriyanagi TaxID=2511006 RepID=A0A9Q0PVT0_9ROSI|nr:hypothetical protein OIU74_014207 [Salix koriyanagi]